MIDVLFLQKSLADVFSSIFFQHISAHIQLSQVLCNLAPPDPLCQVCSKFFLLSAEGLQVLIWCSI